MEETTMEITPLRELIEQGKERKAEDFEGIEVKANQTQLRLGIILLRLNNLAGSQQPTKKQEQHKEIKIVPFMRKKPKIPSFLRRR